jgi:hypothetical protein
MSPVNFAAFSLKGNDITNADYFYNLNTRNLFISDALAVGERRQDSFELLWR